MRLSCFLNCSLFQERVATFPEGLQFLSLAGFSPDVGNEFLVLPQLTPEVKRGLEAAAAELHSAIVNPFFGVL